MQVSNTTGAQSARGRHSSLKSAIHPVPEPKNCFKEKGIGQRRNKDSGPDGIVRELPGSFDRPGWRRIETSGVVHLSNEIFINEDQRTRKLSDRGRFLLFIKISARNFAREEK